MKKCSILLALLISANLAAYPVRDRQQPQQTVVIKELTQELEATQDQVRLLEERLRVQENIVDALRDQLYDTKDAQKELIRGSETAVAGRIASLESSYQGVGSDLKTLRKHLSETAKSVASIQQDIVHLQSAMKSLAGVFKEESSATYKVSAGDSLEKIARRYGISIKELKEMNNLKNDTIFTGQMLRVPIKS